MIVLNESCLWTPKQINTIEKHYHGKYLLDTCLKTAEGEWANFPAAIFYTEKAHPEGSNYFAIYRDHIKGLMINNGYNAIKDPIKGLLIDGAIIYSRYRHDYREFHGIIIDGGRDYFRMGGERMNEAMEVELHVVKDEIKFKFVNSENNNLYKAIPIFPPSTIEI
jgi:hypothetical protein